MVKEWILLLAGLAGITYQLITDNVNVILLIVFSAMTGVPGLAHIVSLIRNSPIVLQSYVSQRGYQDSESENVSQGSSLEDSR